MANDVRIAFRDRLSNCLFALLCCVFIRAYTSLNICCQRMATFKISSCIISIMLCFVFFFLTMIVTMGMIIFLKGMEALVVKEIVYGQSNEHLSISHDVLDNYFSLFSFFVFSCIQVSLSLNMYKWICNATWQYYHIVHFILSTTGNRTSK